MTPDLLPATAADGRRRPRPRRGPVAVAAGLIAVPFVLLTWLVVSRNAVLERADRAVVDAFHARVLPRPWLDRTFEVLAQVTDPTTWRVIAVAMAVVLWRRGRRRLVAWLATTMVVGGLLSPLIKFAVGRPRPEFADPVATASGYSFPSGHALNSMLFAAVVVAVARPVTRGARRAVVWCAAVTIVVVTAVDRLALGVHYPSDVLAGWLVALGTALAALLMIAPDTETRPPDHPHHPDRHAPRA